MTEGSSLDGEISPSSKKGVRPQLAFGETDRERGSPVGVEGSGPNEKSGLNTMLGNYNRGSISIELQCCCFFLAGE